MLGVLNKKTKKEEQVDEMKKTTTNGLKDTSFRNAQAKRGSEFKSNA
jgi:hypothetical protein